MAKKVIKTTKIESKSDATCTSCHECGTCSWLSLVIGIVIIWLAWIYVPSPTWAKWTLIIAGALLVIKRWCPCNRK